MIYRPFRAAVGVRPSIRRPYVDEEMHNAETSFQTGLFYGIGKHEFGQGIPNMGSSTKMALLPYILFFVD